MILTNSEINDFQRCPRLHFLGNVKRLGPIKPPSPLRAAEIGTRVHAALERYYGGATAPEVVASLEADVDVHAETTPGGEQHKASALVLAVSEAYFEWLAETGADQGLTVISPEFTATRTHPDFPGVTFQGKIDLLTDEELIDFKTCAIPLEQKAREVLRATQGAWYVWLLAGSDRRVTRVQFRIMRQSSHSERTSPPYETTAELPINAAMLQSVERNLLEIVPRIQSNYARKDVPPPVPGSDCSWRCDFYQVCPMFDNGEDWQFVLDTEFQEVDPLSRYSKEDHE